MNGALPLPTRRRISRFRAELAAVRRICLFDSSLGCRTTWPDRDESI
jgi:hypothetical protein